MEASNDKGKHMDRPKFDLNTLDKGQKAKLEQKYEDWKSGSITAVQFMTLLKLMKITVYKVIKQYETVN